MSITKQNVINALTPIQLNTVERYSRGMSYEDLAYEDDCTTRAIGWRLRRARAKLQAASTEELCESLGLGCVGHRRLAS